MTRSSVLAVLLVLCPFYSLAQESDDPDDLFTSSTLSGLSVASVRSGRRWPRGAPPTSLSLRTPTLLKA